MDGSSKSPSKKSQAEQDESSAASYWLYAVEFGTHYYIVGRYSMFSGFSVISGNLMHHAVELLLKACLARQDPEPNVSRKPDTWAQIQKYGSRKRYGHDLERLWSEFKTRNPDVTLAEHDEVISRPEQVRGHPLSGQSDSGRRHAERRPIRSSTGAQDSPHSDARDASRYAGVAKALLRAHRESTGWYRCSFAPATATRRF